jgi:hypothetical protein
MNMPIFAAFVASGTTAKIRVMVGFIFLFVLAFLFSLVTFNLAIVEFGSAASTKISRLEIGLNIVDKS